MTPLIISVTPGNLIFNFIISFVIFLFFLANIEMLNRINRSLTEKKENISEEPEYNNQECKDLWDKTLFNDSEFWFLKTG